MAGLGAGKNHGRAHILGMALNLIKIVLLAVLTVLTFGIFPNKLKGAMIAIGTCIAAAVVLHFVAP
jgi:hypothetical protein